ncbi:MAG TPA: PAAR domain-containing protein [Alcanivorax sp.]|nr:PAAR domain-containing protein [Alcanivorax sp.]
MPAVTRLGDLGTGHGSYPPRPNIAGAATVFVNGIPVHRQGDAWDTHCNPAPDCHAGTLSGGSTSVFAEGQAVGRIGDPVSCGSAVAAGSANVFASG